MKLRLWIMALFALLICSAPVFATEADSDDEEGGFYNIVLLIDKSGSMNSTDPKRNAINEAKMFVDSLYTGVQNKWEIGADVQMVVGVMPFSRDPAPEIRFVELASDAAAKGVKETIDAIQYDPSNTGATDLGKAVRAAVDRLSELEDGTRKGLIVLFTDGYTEYLSSEPLKEELEAESKEILKESLARAKEAEYEIYVIGLNSMDSDGKERIQPEGRAEIMRIANETQIGDGLVSYGEEKRNYLITDSFAKIQFFYIGLFADLMRSVKPIETELSENQIPPSGAVPGSLYYDIPIKADGNSCCNIFVISEEGIGNVSLFYPSGAPVDFSDSSDSSDSRIVVKRDSGNKYEILSLWHPVEENWRLGVTPLNGAAFGVQRVPISGVKIKTEVSAIQDGASKIEIRALDGNREQPEEFYRNLINPTCVAIDENNEETDCPLIYDAAKNALTANFSVPTPGSYTLRTRLESEAMAKESKKSVSYDLQIQPLELSLGQGEEVEVNLNDALPDWDGRVKLTATEVVWDSSATAPVETDGSLLTVQGKKWRPATLKFIVRATDSAKNQLWEIPVTADVTWNLMYLVQRLWWVPLLLLLLLAALVCLIVYKQQKEREQKTIKLHQSENAGAVTGVGGSGNATTGVGGNATTGVGGSGNATTGVGGNATTGGSGNATTGVGGNATTGVGGNAAGAVTVPDGVNLRKRKPDQGVNLLKGKGTARK